MTFNPLQNFMQGQKAGTMQQSNRLAGALTGQMGQGKDPSKLMDFQQLMAIDPDRANKIVGSFNALSKERKKAWYEDMVTAKAILSTGDVEGTKRFLTDERGAMLKEFKATDTFSNDYFINNLDAGNIDAVMNALDQGINAGAQMGLIGETKRKGGSVQSSKILDDGTVIEVLKGGGRRVTNPSGQLVTGDEARETVKSSNKKIQDRKIELKNLERTIKSGLAKEGVVNDREKAQQRGNITRLGLLSTTSSGRSSAVKKAIKFKSALEKGEAFSGATRKAASFIPGVFTSQAQFDEEFNAFSEVAARQQLKASGETRPTDSDVKGMKEAMFGIGRDEGVNIQLLNDFIVDQHSQNEELDQLIEASKSGDLSGFTFKSPKTSAQKEEFSGFKVIRQ